MILYPSYPDESDRPLLLSVIQSMWDRGEPDGYANHMTTDPLPNTPEHKVLIEMAYGDHQVANVTTEVEARTIGAPLRMPAVDADRLQPEYTKPFVGLETLGDLTTRAARRLTAAATSSGTSARSATTRPPPIPRTSSGPTRRRSPTRRRTTASESIRTTR